MTLRQQFENASPAAKIAAGLAALIALALLVLVAAGAFRHDAPRPTFFERLALDVGFVPSSSCMLKVRSPDPDLARRWPASQQTAALFCVAGNGFVNGDIHYVRFATLRALAKSLSKRPPQEIYCTFGPHAVLDVDSPKFRRMCKLRNGVLHPAGK
ncbi:MAG: hypothetical protein R2736_10660 [Solirubrobacterales bacterium]